MIGAIDTARTALRPAAATSPDAKDALLRLLLLREIEDAGPLTGAQALDAIAALSCSFDLAAPGYAVIHSLREGGSLDATCERPPRYAITGRGRREAELLAVRCWPGVRDALVHLNVCVGCLAPRDAAALPQGSTDASSRRRPAVASRARSRTARAGAASMVAATAGTR